MSPPTPVHLWVGEDGHAAHPQEAMLGASTSESFCGDPVTLW